ncbi:MAG TPA: NAD(FAD)-dependent dehydrogenase, partial [Lachnospiraceae bacterium]|nr:NAD(FAD)-dependent dehydrogenase [Lachnospiraceae bacterium]
PKHKMQECIRELAAIELQTPVYAGEVVKENIAGTGIAVVATKDIA